VKPFLLLAFVSAALIAQTPPAPKLIEVPLLDCSGLPCVEMTAANGKTLRLLIDTAEVNSYLDTKAAQNLGLELKPLAGSTSNEIQQTVVPGAKIGDLLMGDFPFLVLDTTEQPNKPNEKMQPLPGDGMLTYGAFKNRLLQIDYPHHLVRISEPQDTAPPCPRTCSDLVVKHLGSHGPVTLTTTGFTINSQPVEVQVDTLFTGTLLVYPASVEKLGLKKESKSKHKELFPYISGGIKLAQFDGVASSFHGFQLAQQAPVYFFTSDDHPSAVPFDVTVGSGLLKNGTVTLDFKGMKMWMEAGAGQP
jgi:hypothetical protein